MDGSELPMVSVITGFYNRGHLLDRTLRSLLNQTYPNLEIIVFDDASTDDTSLRLGAYERLGDPRLRIIRRPKNLGFVGGMIDSIRESRGEFIAVQGSGDSSEPTRIELQARCLVENPDIGVVGCYYKNIVEEKKVVRVRKPNASSASIETLQTGNVFSHGEVMFRRDIYDKAGGYRREFKYCQDRDLWIRMIRLTSFSTVPEVLYNRYVQFDGVSYAPDKAALQARYSLICGKLARSTADEEKQIIDALREKGPTAIILSSDKAYVKKILRAAMRAIVWGNTAQAYALADRQDSQFVRGVVRLTGALYSNPVFSPAKRVLDYVIGVRTLSA